MTTLQIQAGNNFSFTVHGHGELQLTAVHLDICIADMHLDVLLGLDVEDSNKCKLDLRNQYFIWEARRSLLTIVHLDIYFAEIHLDVLL